MKRFLKGELAFLPLAE